MLDGALERAAQKQNARIGKYPLEVEIRRDIALLGFDFIDRCRFTHEPEGDIVLAEFDLNGYGVASGAMDCDEVIAFLDSLSE